MHDAAELLIRPIATALLYLARGLLWLGWDFCVQTVGWTVGWLVCRFITAGRFPAERVGDLDDAPGGVAFFVELIGLACLAALAWILGSYLGI